MPFSLGFEERCITRSLVHRVITILMLVQRRTSYKSLERLLLPPTLITYYLYFEANDFYLFASTYVLMAASSQESACRSAASASLRRHWRFASGK
jgi:hypothetical protein